MITKRKYFNNVAGQFLIYIIPVLIISLLIFSGIFFTFLKNQEIDKHSASAEILIEKTNKALMQWIDSQISIAKIIAANPQIIDICLNPLNEEARQTAQLYLSDMHARFKNNENIPIALKLDNDESLDLNINGRKIEITNGNFIIDTVKGKTIGKCGPDFSYIPPIFEQDKEYFISEVYPSILQGAPIFVISVPVKIDSKVLGAVVVAPRMDYFTDMFIEDAKLGNTGYLFMIDDRGTFISHPEKEYILKNETNNSAANIIQNIKAGENSFVTYYDDIKKIYSVARFTSDDYNILHNWYIVSTRNYKEILSHAYKMMIIIVLCIIILSLFITFIVLNLARRIITNPLNRLKKATDNIANGYLTDDIAPEKTENEIASLNRAIHNMTLNLRSQTGIIFKAVSMLEESSKFINESVEEQQKIAQNNKQATSEIASAVLEITSTSRELAATMQHVKNTANSTEKFADASKSNLQILEETINQQEKSTYAIKDRLSDIKEKADNIGLIITTISKIATQTNLLSLNASIEAEKAGEAGGGFMVISREIRRLADQTASSTLNIERIVKEMQNSVSSGVNEMAKFAEEVQKGIKVAAEAGIQITETISQVKELTPQFSYVNEGMHAQSQGAEEISVSMQRLNNDTDKTIKALEQITNAADHLEIASNNLKKEISKFKI